MAQSFCNYCSVYDKKAFFAKLLGIFFFKINFITLENEFQNLSLSNFYSKFCHLQKFSRPQHWIDYFVFWCKHCFRDTFLFKKQKNVFFFPLVYSKFSHSRSSIWAKFSILVLAEYLLQHNFKRYLSVTLCAFIGLWFMGLLGFIWWIW